VATLGGTTQIGAFLFFVAPPMVAKASTVVTRSLKKNHPIFGNVAQTVAKLQKLKLKVENSCIKLLLNVKISTTNCV
jgi:hypothetical protein